MKRLVAIVIGLMISVLVLYPGYSVAGQEKTFEKEKSGKKVLNKKAGNGAVTRASGKVRKKENRNRKKFDSRMLARERTMKRGWISQIERLYYKDSLTLKERKYFFQTLETYLGIRPTGHLNYIQARNAEASLESAYLDYSRDMDNPSYNIYFADKLNFLGFNYIYFEVCARYKKRNVDRFIRYFENGFYPNKFTIPQNGHYYRIFYYYLYMVQDRLNNRIYKATQYLDKNPNRNPDFNINDIRNLFFAVKVSSELDAFRVEGEAVENSPYNKVFTDKERLWLKETTGYFLSIETHSALASYEWFNRHIPLSVSSQAIAYSINQTWKKQARSYRTRLPLMLFVDEESTKMNIDTLFQTTLNKMKLDNREVDILILTALKTWLAKQIKHGIRVEDRVKYREILEEIEVCPSGWIYYNLYGCKEELGTLKTYADKWDSMGMKKKRKLFQSKIKPAYSSAKEKIDIVFNDLEKVFGKQTNNENINYVFHKYRGEIDYYYEYLQFGIMKKNEFDVRLPLANSRENCLKHFKAAFLKADALRENHVNLLKAYNLLFRELVAQNEITAITKYEAEMERFISGKHRLGSILSLYENNLYDIYRLIANSYLSQTELETRALQVAKRSFDLAKSYYVTAAKRTGYYLGDHIGAISGNRIEADEYERQFELYQKVAQKLGKKIQLLLPEEDVQLYNNMQKNRNSKEASL